MSIQCAYRWRDGHIVVIQDHYEWQVVIHACVIHRFKSHATGHGAIANHSNSYLFFAFSLEGSRHSHRRRNTR